MTSPLDPVEQQVAMVSAKLAERADDVALALGDAVLHAASESGDAAGEFHHRVAELCAANGKSILLSLTAGNEFDPTQAAAVGVARAEAGQSLAAAVGSGRLGFPQSSCRGGQPGRPGIGPKNPTRQWSHGKSNPDLSLAKAPFYR
jgi:hypothetical protein